MSRVAINRPWMSSFEFNTVEFSEKQLEQFHKLCRNFVASLNLGCPSAKHVTKIGFTEDTRGLSERELYLLWVRDWKFIYRQLSTIIRNHKLYRRTIRFPKLSADQLGKWQMVNREVNLAPTEHLRGLSARHLERLQETAMVLLNARYNAKLASAERRRRVLAGLVSITGNAPVSKTDDAGSIPALAAE